MKSRILMATLVVALLLGARTYAGDCGPCDAIDCNGCSKSCDLFSGLKVLAACKPCAMEVDCGPCDSIVACSPCDVAECTPCGSCGDLGCDNGCNKKVFKKRPFKGLFADRACDPCGEVVDCDTGCDVGCDMGCDAGCDNGCNACDPCGHHGRRFSFKKFFGGFRNGGKCSDGCCDPCGCDTGCGAGCDNGCGCDTDCGPCDVSCDANCGPKYGHCIDKPRRQVKRFFDNLFACEKSCNPCDPCGTGSCDPCEPVCDPCGHTHYRSIAAPAASQLPEAAN